MAKEKLSEAEKYRLERKKRIQKSKKKKNSYRSRTGYEAQHTDKKIGIAVAVVLAVAITFGLLYYFGVFHRIVPAATVNGKSVSVAVMNCAFTDVKNQAYSASQQYEQQGGTAFYSSDTKLTDSCIYDETKTWGDYFQEQALEHIKQVYAFKDAEGNTVTEDQQKSISETFDSLQSSADSNGYSLEAYVRAAYGIGVNSTVLRSWLEDVYKAENAQTAIQDKYADSLSDEQINEYYKEHVSEYVTASVKAYTVSVDATAITSSDKTDLTKKEKDKLIKSAKATAQEVANKILAAAEIDATSFRKAVNSYEKTKENPTTYLDSNLQLSGIPSKNMTSLGAKAIEWICSAKSAGEAKAIYSANYDSNTFQFDIVLIEEPAQAYSTINVRHILVQPEDTKSKDSWAEAKEKIDDIYKQWKQDPTEDNFAAIATEQTSDTGSKENGGLYENVTPGQMVDTFNDWCFDTSRKTGDNGIVKTTYGYHLMYFVSNNGPYWKTNIPTVLASENLNTVVSDTLEDYTASRVNFGWGFIKEVIDYKDAQKTTTTTTTTAQASEEVTQ